MLRHDNRPAAIIYERSVALLARALQGVRIAMFEGKTAACKRECGEHAKINMGRGAEPPLQLPTWAGINLSAWVFAFQTC